MHKTMPSYSPETSLVTMVSSVVRFLGHKSKLHSINIPFTHPPPCNRSSSADPERMISLTNFISLSDFLLIICPIALSITSGWWEV